MNRLAKRDLSDRPSIAVLLAVILAGGFGIVRALFVQSDLLAVAAIALSLGFAWLCLGVFRFGLSSSSKAKQPIDLAATATDRFVVHPGRPQGYAGYTDYTAMSVDVNDDLVTRQPEQQYALVGFATGFLNAIRERLGAADESGSHRFRMIEATRSDCEGIGWLGHLQQSGTDNAGPSTDNLHSVLHAVSTALCSTGPITRAFWDKAHNGKTESLAASRTRPEMLQRWIALHDNACSRGRQLALGAAIERVGTVHDH